MFTITSCHPVDLEHSLPDMCTIVAPTLQDQLSSLKFDGRCQRERRTASGREDLARRYRRVQMFTFQKRIHLLHL